MKIPRQLREWFALLGGALAWFFHLMTTYAIGEFACVLDAHGTALFLLFLVTVLALGVTLLSLWVSWRIRSGFMGQAGLLADAIFLFVILSQSAPIFTLVEGC